MFDAGIISEEEFNRFNPIGSEHDDIDVEVDGTKYVEHKIKSMKAHRSQFKDDWWGFNICLLYTSPSPRDRTRSRMPSSA